MAAAVGTLTAQPVERRPVTGNRSLDEFADEAPADAAADGADSSPAGEPRVAAETVPEAAVADTATADADDDASVAPKAETFAWSADGAACGRCGSTVERRWRDGDELVCEDCKAW